MKPVLTIASVGLAVAFAAGGWIALAGGSVWLGIGLLLGGIPCIALPALTRDRDDGPGPGGWGPDGRRWSMSDDEFDDLVAVVESSGHGSRPADAFEQLVAEAVEELPEWVKDELDANGVAVIVGDDLEYYGLYVPSGTGPSPRSGARIVIYRNTLIRDFEDPEELKRQVAITVRHEVAHHLGADERRVRDLGL